MDAQMMIAVALMIAGALALGYREFNAARRTRPIVSRPALASFDARRRARIPVWTRGATMLIAPLLLAACASAPRAPTEALHAAELAIANAEQGRVADYASPELGEAREELTAARAAVQREQMVLAYRLAERSRVNAELASAKSDAAKAQAVNAEMLKSTEALKQEMQRNPGVSP